MLNERQPRMHPGAPQPAQPGETRGDPLGSWARGLAPGSVSDVSGVEGAVGLWPRNSRVDRSMFISDAEPHSPEDDGGGASAASPEPPYSFGNCLCNYTAARNQENKLFFSPNMRQT